MTLIPKEIRKNLSESDYMKSCCYCKSTQNIEWEHSLKYNEFYSSEENARKGIQEIKEILFRRGDEIQKRMLEIIYENDSEKD